jgi:HEPN domain-containing protein
LIAEKVKRWLIKATEDLKVIEHEIKLSEEEMAKGAVCFHCQQFVEKPITLNS